MTWIVNCWYVIAWGGEGDRTPIARTICDVPVTLYRRLNRERVNRSICVESYADSGGVRARQLIERARRATRPSAEEIAA